MAGFSGAGGASGGGDGGRDGRYHGPNPFENDGDDDDDSSSLGQEGFTPNQQNGSYVRRDFEIDCSHPRCEEQVRMSRKLYYDITELHIAKCPYSKFYSTGSPDMLSYYDKRWDGTVIAYSARKRLPVVSLDVMHKTVLCLKNDKSYCVRVGEAVVVGVRDPWKVNPVGNIIQIRRGMSEYISETAAKMTWEPSTSTRTVAFFDQYEEGVQYLLPPNSLLFDLISPTRDEILQGCQELQHVMLHKQKHVLLYHPFRNTCLPFRYCNMEHHFQLEYMRNWDVKYQEHDNLRDLLRYDKWTFENEVASTVTVNHHEAEDYFHSRGPLCLCPPGHHTRPPRGGGRGGGGGGGRGGGGGGGGASGRGRGRPRGQQDSSSSDRGGFSRQHQQGRTEPDNSSNQAASDEYYRLSTVLDGAGNVVYQGRPLGQATTNTLMKSLMPAPKTPTVPVPVPVNQHDQPPTYQAGVGGGAGATASATSTTASPSVSSAEERQSLDSYGGAGARPKHQRTQSETDLVTPQPPPQQEPVRAITPTPDVVHRDQLAFAALERRRRAVLLERSRLDEEENDLLAAENKLKHEAELAAIERDLAARERPQEQQRQLQDTSTPLAPSPPLGRFALRPFVLSPEERQALAWFDRDKYDAMMEEERRRHVKKISKASIPILPRPPTPELLPPTHSSQPEPEPEPEPEPQQEAPGGSVAAAAATTTTETNIDQELAAVAQQQLGINPSWVAVVEQEEKATVGEGVTQDEEPGCEVTEGESAEDEQYVTASSGGPMDETGVSLQAWRHLETDQAILGERMANVEGKLNGITDLLRRILDKKPDLV